MSFKALIAAACIATTLPLLSVGSQASTVGGGVLPPFAYIQFCVHHSSACSDSKGRLPTTDGRKVTITPKLQRQLATVNASVNAKIMPRSRGPGDPWTQGGNFGDCNSYALTKRSELIAAGWPSQALSLTVVKTSWGEGHLVLAVHTNTDVVVLDNLSHAVRPLTQVPYRIISMQAGSALHWSNRSDYARSYAVDSKSKISHVRFRTSHDLLASLDRVRMKRSSTIAREDISLSEIPPNANAQLSKVPHSLDVLQNVIRQLSQAPYSLALLQNVMRQLSQVPYSLAVLQSEPSQVGNRRDDL